MIVSTATTGITLPGGLRIITGAGAPGMNAPVGSLYLNTSAVAIDTRLYVAVDATGTWTAFKSVA